MKRHINTKCASEKFKTRVLEHLAVFRYPPIAASRGSLVKMFAFWRSVFGIVLTSRLPSAGPCVQRVSLFCRRRVSAPPQPSGEAARLFCCERRGAAAGRGVTAHEWLSCRQRGTSPLANPWLRWRRFRIRVCGRGDQRRRLHLGSHQTLEHFLPV